MVEVRDWLGRCSAGAAPTPGWSPRLGLLAEPLRGHPLARVYLAGSAAAERGDVAEASV